MTRWASGGDPDRPRHADGPPGLGLAAGWDPWPQPPVRAAGGQGDAEALIGLAHRLAMAAPLVIERLALLAQAGPQAIAVAGGPQAALALLEDADPGLVILHRQAAQLGEQPALLGFTQPWRSPPLRCRGPGAALGLGSPAQQTHSQGQGDQGTPPAGWGGAGEGGCRSPQGAWHQGAGQAERHGEVLKQRPPKPGQRMCLNDG